jgi:hypothetical protein
MQDCDRIRMGILFPTEQVMLNSSLAHYLAVAVREFGTEDSHYLVDEDGIDTMRVMIELAHAEQTGEP